MLGPVVEAILENDSELAKECYDALKDDVSAMLFPKYWFSNINGRILCLLNLTMGDVDAAIDYFDESYRFCRQAGR